MNTLLHPTYFSNIASFVSIVHAKNVVFEVCDNYQKQTYRNRTNIYGANGKLALNVPVTHSHNNRQLYKDVKIANDGKWQSQHWKSLQSAYKTSPFFEYYEDELAPLFHTRQNYILEYNFQCLEVILECLQLELDYTITTIFQKELIETHDSRFLVNARKEKELDLDSYTQVFSSKHGFLNNLSILDLLFNESTNALNYLESQKPIL